VAKHFKKGELEKLCSLDFHFKEVKNRFKKLGAQLEAGTCGRGNLPFRDPLNQERRFIPLRLDDAIL